MKKVIALFLIAPALLIAQQTRIPDVNFEQHLIDLGLDDVLDGGVATVNISTIRTLDISNSNISDLSGINDFIGLENLNCMNNNLTSLPINYNIYLK